MELNGIGDVRRDEKTEAEENWMSGGGRSVTVAILTVSSQQTPYFWPSNCWEPENTDYAVYLCKRTMQNKARLELADYEAENLARLQKMFSRKWEFIFMQVGPRCSFVGWFDLIFGWCSIVVCRRPRRSRASTRSATSWSARSSTARSAPSGTSTVPWSVLPPSATPFFRLGFIGGTELFSFPAGLRQHDRDGHQEGVPHAPADEERAPPVGGRRRRPHLAVRVRRRAALSGRLHPKGDRVPAQEARPHQHQGRCRTGGKPARLRPTQKCAQNAHFCVRTSGLR